MFAPPRVLPNAAWDFIKWAVPKAAGIGAVSLAAMTIVVEWLSTPSPAWLPLAVFLFSGIVWALSVAVGARLTILKPQRVTVVLRQDGTGFSPGFAYSPLALVVPFKNVPSWWHWRMDGEDRVTAQIDFFDTHGLIQRSVAGCWVGERGNAICIPVGQVRMLIIAIAGEKKNEPFSVPESPPITPQDLVGVANNIDAYRRGALVTFKAIHETAGTRLHVRVALTSSQGMSMASAFGIGLNGDASWIEISRQKVR